MQDYSQLFEVSYARVIGTGTRVSEQGTAFFARFYENFLQKSPAIEEMFRDTDMHRQIGMLQKSFFAVAGMHVTGSAGDYIYSIAESHSKSNYNVKPEYYDLWLDALTDTVAELDTQFDPEVELAWRLALTPGIVLMKHYYSNPATS